MTSSPRRLAAVVLCLLLLASCGAGDDADIEAPPGIDLPEVGTLGRAPKGPGAITVDVTAGGRITLGDSEPLSLKGLQRELTRLTASTEWREPDHSSLKTLLINADKDLPWTVAAWIVQTAADPRIAIPRIFFGARGRTDGRVGALGMALPRDNRPQIVDFAEQPRLKLRITPGDGVASRPEEAFDAMVAAAGDSPISEVVLYLQPVPGERALPHGFVVEILDIAVRANIERFEMWGTMMPPDLRHDDADAFQDRVAELRSRMGTPVLEARSALPAEADRPPRADVLPAPRGRLPRLLGVGVESEEPRPEPEADLPPRSGTIEPVIDDEELEEMEGEDNDLPFEEFLDSDGLTDAPFEGPPASSPPWVERSRSTVFDERPRPTKDEAHTWPLGTALERLVATQARSGGWERERGDGAHCDAGTTGLAVLAFLGAGHTNRGSHPYKQTVKRGLRFLKNVQDAEGCFGPRSSARHLEDHAYAALAIIEAYGLTWSPIFKGSAQRAVDYIVQTQDESGGWRGGTTETNDAVLTAWMALPLAVAHRINQDAEAREKRPPFRIPEKAIQGILASLDALSSGGPGPRAAALFLRVFLGEESVDGLLTDAVRVAKHLPALTPESASTVLATWHWTTLGLQQVGGAPQQIWHAAFLESAQAVKSADDVRTTALMALCLEAPTRYTRPAR